MLTRSVLAATVTTALSIMTTAPVVKTSTIAPEGKVTIEGSNEIIFACTRLGKGEKAACKRDKRAAYIKANPVGSKPNALPPQVTYRSCVRVIDRKERGLCEKKMNAATVNLRFNR